MPLGPTVRRRRLGAELRRLREAHSLKLEEVAENLGLAPSTLSRIETGKAPTKSAYLTAMLAMYEVTDPGARKVLVDMAREGHRKGWWSIYEDVLPSGFDIYVGLEAEASGLRSYESYVVHGLLQTTDYALTVLRELRPRDSEEQLERVVDLRMERQRLLDSDPPLDVWIILDEGAIRRKIGGAAIMRRQLEHLVQASRWSNVTLQVLPFEAGAHAGLVGPFAILEFPERSDSDVAYTESLSGMIYLEKDREVRACAEAFDRMRAVALSPAASVELIQQVALELALSRLTRKNQPHNDKERRGRWTPTSPVYAGSRAAQAAPRAASK
ncbi:MAG TPA: helix-turn-helix transcriptional regulator [Streptosporangiaceae bacterium]|nr:helix-turn-helix transcriptional regulator [Streptosporangiaceae bacterium]